MTKRYDLDISFNYRIRSKYNKLLKARELVNGAPIQLRITVTNKSQEDFPGTSCNILFNEYGMSIGTGSLGWTPDKKQEIPYIKVNESIEMETMTFTPMLAGIANVNMTIVEPEDTEIWLRGVNQAIPKQRNYKNIFRILNWENLELITLLKAGGK